MSCNPELHRIVKVNGVKAVCRKYLALMVGTYEADAIEETLGATVCELDCESETSTRWTGK